MKNKKLFQHFQDLKGRSCLPSAFLISNSQSSHQSLLAGIKILQMINCPQELDCSQNCKPCQMFKQQSHHLIFQFNEIEDESKLQVEELISWSKIYSQNSAYKFVIFPNIENLSSAITAPLLKWIENLPEKVIIFAASQLTSNIYPALLSRFQIFPLDNVETNTHKQFNLLSAYEQFLYQELNSSEITNEIKFLEKTFLPLVRLVENFLHKFNQKEVYKFLTIKPVEEALILANFWEFERILLLFVHGIIQNHSGFEEHNKKWIYKKRLLIELIKNIQQQLEEKQTLYNKNKNSPNVKLIFLELLASAQILANGQIINNTAS